ncbi:MAG: hypothetical protein WBG43_10770 [Marinifilaceae bacterium]
MKKSVILSLIVLLILGSWFKILDKYSEDYVNDSLVEAGVAYGTARGINGVVSVLQSTEVEFGLGVSGSMTLGEILDPLNDLIERFSDVMFVVISSLMLQKILVLIVSNTVFTVALTCLGIFSGLMILLKSNVYLKSSLRFFLVFVVIRFSIVFVLILNSLVGDLFLSDQISSGNNELKNGEEKFRSMSGDDVSNAKFLEITNMISDKTSEKVVLEKDLLLITQKIKKMDSNSSWYSAKDNKYKSLEKKQGDIEDKVEALQNDIDTGRDELKGGSSILDKFTKIKDSLTPSVISAKVSDMVDNIFNLLMLFLLQSVLIPLLFLYSLKYLVKLAWNMKIEL